MYLFRLGVHYLLHLVFPGVIAHTFFRQQWKKAWIIMVATMLVDLDHFFANPLYDANRCSIGFHPLHSFIAILIYCFGVVFPKTRIIAIGLLFHMFTDYLDCLFINVR